MSEKAASTAFVRRLAQGVLSPQTVQRAAAAMPQGKFRFVRNLGRGQFSVADQVAGNFGPGKAGLAVRKMPTTQVSPTAEYGPTAQLTEQLNQHFRPSILQRAYARVQGKQAAPPLTPYMDVNEQGGFQAMADGYVPWLPRRLRRTIGDLHSGNIGQGGQVFDYSLEHISPSMGTLAQGMSPTGLREMFNRPRIDSALAAVKGQVPQQLMDLLGNTAYQPPRVREAIQPVLEQSNNAIRRYWNMPADQRGSYLSELRRRNPERMQAAYKAFMKTPSGGTATASHTPRKIGMWTDFQYDPKPYLTMAGLGGTGAGGVGYGAYKAYQHLAGGE